MGGYIIAMFLSGKCVLRNLQCHDRHSSACYLGWTHRPAIVTPWFADHLVPPFKNPSLVARFYLYTAVLMKIEVF
jgi:hypothetical protein